ncbi:MULTISPECIES: hypothetical protein [Pseudomonas]|uniref:Uncharacterized protein n=1 Tax=Pseudomonas putida S13.1.2 TaxID=1384061 RepID=A0AAU8SHU1_PSEPU|nr:MULTISPECIES: hypothetical protein [Pseudomonas]AJQ50986.1 hypothetical protein N805_28705 [Pseudomonas putida S13.1.2]
MEIKNNPVGRLHDILREASLRQDAEVTRSVWERVLDAPEGDAGTLLSRLADLVQLQREAKQALIDGVEGDPSIYLAPFEKIDLIFSRIDLSTRWDVSKQYLDNTTLSALAFGNHVLQVKYSNPQINNAQTSEFIEALDRLLHQCLNSELPTSLKQMFTSNLESLRQALIAYRISGTNGIEAEIDRIIGAMSRHSSTILDQKDEKSITFMRSVFELVSGINDSIQLAENAVRLSGPAVVALLPLFQ